MKSKKKAKARPKTRTKKTDKASRGSLNLYRLEMAMEMPKAKVRYYVFENDLDEITAERHVMKFKRAGIGGRLFLLDGSPNGKLQETWGGVDRVAEAAVIENKALTS